MNSDYTQNLRHKLQKRVRKLNSTDKSELYHFALQRFWKFIESNSVFVGIVDDLAARCPQMLDNVDGIVKRQSTTVGDSELEEAALALFVIRNCVARSDAFENYIGLSYDRNGGLDGFNNVFLEPLYEYLDEQLDDQRAVLSLLRRYKHKCEWFQRSHLNQILQGDTRKGEKNLAKHLYEYLYDQGMDFSIEPYSAIGKPDLVAAQNSDDPLIADTKIFSKSTGKSYIAKGFNQIYQYTLTYNEPFGYLIIFNSSGKDLKFAVTQNNQFTPCVTHNNKTIFIITVDIFEYETTASTRGVLETIEITEQELIHPIEENLSQE
jgi:hypothetical protein